MQEAGAPLLQIAGLRKCYGDFSLDDVSLQVPEGCVVGLVGANGAGKSTIIKCILGLTQPDSGSIRLFGEELAGMSQADFVQARSRIGVVFDTCAFPDVLSVREAARIASRAYPAFDCGLFDSLADRLGVPCKKRVKELSRGTGMKLSIALALAARPELLILDEATAGLDPLARGEVIGLLRDCMLQAEEEGCGVRGILMSSHISEDLEKLADYVVCLDEGKVVFSVEACQITDSAGVAHCTHSDLERVRCSDLGQLGALRVLQRPYCIDVLVPDRQAFALVFPDIAIERVGLDEYLAFFLKGDVL